MAYKGGLIEYPDATQEAIFFRADSRATKTITIKQGQVLKARSFIETDVAGKGIAHSGVATKKIAGVTVYDVDASTADVVTSVYIEASFWSTALVWAVNVLTDTILKDDGVTTVAVTAYDTGANTDLLKAKFVENTEFEAIGFLKAGEML